MKPRFHTLTVKEIRKETENTVSILFSIPNELKKFYDFQPGQFLTLRKNIHKEEVRRSFSICSAHYENELRVAIKVLKDGKFSQYAANVMKEGEEIEVMTPTGNFTTHVDENTEKSFLFVAAGSGITPIISLIKTILHTAPKSNVALIYGNRGYNHVIFKDELEKLKNQYSEKFNYIHVLSREKIGNPIQEGRIEKEKLELLYNDFLKGVDFNGGVFVCGPEPIIITTKEFFERKGYDSQHIHSELFVTTEGIVEDNTNTESTSSIKEAEVTVIIDDNEYNFLLKESGMSVLDAANEAGADAPFSCKGGVCSTCRAKVLEGKVKMDKNYALEEDELEAGYILTCQSHPITDKLVVSYDD